VDPFPDFPRGTGVVLRDLTDGDPVLIVFGEVGDPFAPDDPDLMIGMAAIVVGHGGGRSFGHWGGNSLRLTTRRSIGILIVCYGRTSRGRTDSLRLVVALGLFEAFSAIGTDSTEPMLWAT
jgi:hypothetical protein